MKTSRLNQRSIKSFLTIIFFSFVMFSSYQAEAQFNKILKKETSKLKKKKKTPSKTASVKKNTGSSSTTKSKNSSTKKSKSEEIILEKGHPATKPFFQLKMHLRRGELAIEKNRFVSESDMKDARKDLASCKELASDKDWSSYENRVVTIENAMNKRDEGIAKRIEQGKAADKIEDDLRDAIRAVFNKSTLDLNRTNTQVEGVEYGKMAKKVDWDKLNELNEDEVFVYNVGTQEDFNKGFPAYVDRIIIKHINEQLDATHAENKGASLDAAYNALGFCEGALIFIPDNSELTGLKAEANSRIGIIKKELEKFMTSPYHTSHVNQMMAADKYVSIGSESDATYKTDFKAEDNIYFVSYWRQSIKRETSGGKYNAKGLDGLKEVGLSFDVDDGTYGFSAVIPTDKKDIGSSSVVQFCITPPISAISAAKMTMHELEGYKDIFSGLKKLSPRKHTIKVKYSSENIFESIFTIEGNKEHYQKLYDKTLEAIIDARRMPKRAISEPEIEARAKAVVTKEKGQCLRVVTAKYWTVNKNTLGIPLSKSTLLYAAYKDGNGNCYYLALNAVREYTGGGNYSKAQIRGGGITHLQINCANVNK